MANGNQPFQGRLDDNEIERRTKEDRSLFSRQPSTEANRPTPGFRSRFLSTLLGVASGARAAGQAGARDPLSGFLAGITAGAQAPTPEMIEAQRDLEQAQIRQQQLENTPAQEIIAPEVIQRFEDAGIPVRNMSLRGFNENAEQNLRLLQFTESLDEFQTSARRNLPLSEDQAKFYASITGRKQEEFQGRTLDEIESAFGIATKAARLRTDDAIVGLDLKTKLSTESGLRKELSGLNKTFLTVRDSIQRVRASGKDPSAAGDLALIFNFMKILDPGSVVRESEFRNAEISRAFLDERGVPEGLVRLRENVLKGARLTPTQREDFLNRAEVLFDSQKQALTTRQQAFSGIAERAGVDVRNVVLPIFGVERPKTDRVNEIKNRIKQLEQKEKE